MKKVYKILAKSENYAIAIPHEHKLVGINDYSIVIKLDTLQFYEGISILVEKVLNKNYTDKDLIKLVRAWNNYPLEKTQIK